MSSSSSKQARSPSSINLNVRLTQRGIFPIPPTWCCRRPDGSHHTNRASWVKDIRDAININQFMLAMQIANAEQSLKISGDELPPILPIKSLCLGQIESGASQDNYTSLLSMSMSTAPTRRTSMMRKSTSSRSLTPRSASGTLVRNRESPRRHQKTSSHGNVDGLLLT